MPDMDTVREKMGGAASPAAPPEGHSTDDQTAARTLLIGMGNPILSDDAVGIRLARDLRARLGARADVDVIEECCVGGLNLLDLVTGYDRLIVLDSIKTTDGRPGTWYRFDATALRETMNLTNVHDTNFATALELGRRMGSRVPADGENHIFAVEIVDNLTFSEDLTPELEAAYPEVAEEILGEVETLLA
jgi:hydrogenase maturation protease